jgi:hypothetical protein
VQVKEGFVNMRVRGLATARSFGLIGGVYATVECSLEQWRG